jgi:hypothetical protein
MQYLIICTEEGQCVDAELPIEDHDVHLDTNDNDLRFVYF